MWSKTRLGLPRPPGPSRAMVVALATLAAAATTASAAVSPGPAPPPNDNRDSAQVISTLPASVNGTTVGATREPGEPESTCASAATDHSVWYQLGTGAKQRVGADLSANGKLDGAVDVYREQRSQLTPVACDQTDVHGKAALTFVSAKGATYLVRVSQLSNSDSGTFSLDIFHPREPENPPGSPLPSGGAQGQVDRIQDVNQAYSVALRAGHSYRINLVNESPGACVHAGLYAPGTGSFDGASALLRLRCTSYRLFTPGAGAGGRYSLQVTPQASYRGVQRFHLQVAEAGPADTAPGLPLTNYAHARGRLDGGHVTVIRLYHFDVVNHSNLTLKLAAPDRASFDLELRDDNGRRLACSCGGSGAQTLTSQMQPGRYFAVLRARDGTSGNYTLVRESRAITTTGLGWGVRRSTAPPGQTVPIVVTVRPAVSGPVAITIERFDPLAGWQFYRLVHATVSGGTARVPFRPPAAGRWRAAASYGGSRTSSPSSSGSAELLVASPLHQ